MDTQSVSAPVIVAALIVSVLLFGFLGWRYLNAPLRDAEGQDLAKAAVMPPNISYSPKPATAGALRDGDRRQENEMPTENQSLPRRDLKGLWLLPVLALGLGVFVSSWKKPAPQPAPTTFGASERAKYDVYRESKYLLMGRLGQGQPKGFTVIGFAPYSDGLVTKMDADRLHCSSSLTVRSKAGGLWEERWQCVITGDHDNWVCEGFEHTPPERLPPSRAGQGAAVAGLQ